MQTNTVIHCTSLKMATVLGPNGDEVSVNLRFHYDRPQNKKNCVVKRGLAMLLML